MEIPIEFFQKFQKSDLTRFQHLIVKGGQNLPPLVVIGSTDLQNIGGRALQITINQQNFETINRGHSITKWTR